jgi:heme-degrading monooxygenase HmoA
MHARVTMMQSQRGQRDELVRIYQESVVPAAQRQPGFKGALLLTDPHSDKGISLTLWESEAAMVAGETTGYYQEQIRKFGMLFVAPPNREHYEVSVQADASEQRELNGR